MTNPKCQITQQSRIDNCRQVRPGKRFPIFLFKTKTRTTRAMAKLFHFLACNLWKKKDLNSQDSATTDVIQIYRLLRSMRDRWDSSASVRQRRFQLHKYSMDFFNLFRSSLYVTHFISIKVLKRYATCLLERCP